MFWRIMPINVFLYITFIQNSQKKKLLKMQMQISTEMKILWQIFFLSQKFWGLVESWTCIICDQIYLTMYIYFEYIRNIKHIYQTLDISDHVYIYIKYIRYTKYIKHPQGFGWAAAHKMGGQGLPRKENCCRCQLTLTLI